jgi:RNA polymerase sigma-70 factor (ECF subfamily)
MAGVTERPPPSLIDGPPSGRHRPSAAAGPTGGGLDEGAFRELVRAHHRLVYAICFQVLRRAEDAEDAAQEAFLKAYRNRAELRDRDTATGWLARIARNAALDAVRRRARRQQLADELTEREEERGEEAGAAPRAEPVFGDEKEKLARALGELSEEDGLVVTLRFIDGLTPQEIAGRLGEKPGTIRVRLHRALKRLREALGVGRGDVGEDGLAGLGRGAER